MYSSIKLPRLAIITTLLSALWMTACIQPSMAGNSPRLSINPITDNGGKAMVSLLYRGPQEFGMDDPSQCTTMQLDSSQKTTLGLCDGSTRLLSLGKRFALDWEDIQNRFVSFTYTTTNESVAFTGRGTISGEAWQRAVLAWARVTHAELATRRVSATGRTVMGWYFARIPDQDNVCAHLTVLNYGFAYAETVNCDGGEVIETTGDWLTDAEMTQLDQWLYQRAPLYVERNYLDGQGSSVMSEVEATAVAEWAKKVRARIWKE